MKKFILRISKACKNKINKFIYASSSSVYGIKEEDNEGDEKVEDNEKVEDKEKSINEEKMLLELKQKKAIVRVALRLLLEAVGC